jgi:hypothetical protein
MFPPPERSTARDDHESNRDREGPEMYGVRKSLGQSTEVGGYMSDELNLLPVKGAQDLGRRLTDRERRTADEGYRSTDGPSHTGRTSDHCKPFAP